MTRGLELEGAGFTAAVRITAQGITMPASTAQRALSEHRTHLAEQVEWADELEACRSTPEVARVLRGILDDHAPVAVSALQEAAVDAIVEALTNPVAFANRKGRERGRWQGDREARQHMAGQLRLGNLAEEEFRG